MLGQRVVFASLALLVCVTPARAADYLSSSDLDQAGLAKHWQIRVPLDDGQRVTGAFLVGDQVYVCTQDGYAFALHANTGAIRWLRQVTRGGYRLWPPAHHGRQVIFATPGEVVVFDRVYGDGLAQQFLRYPCSTPPVADEKSYYLGGDNNRFYSYSAEKHEQEWKRMTTGPVAGRMAIHEGILYLATQDGKVYAAKPASQAAAWPDYPQSRGKTTAGVVTSDAGVFVPSHDQSLRLYNHPTGTLVWRARLSSPLTELPVVTPDTAYQFSDADGLAAIDVLAATDDERIRWKLPYGRKLVSVDDKLAYVLTQRESLAVVDAAKGTQLREIPTPGFTMAAPVVDATAIYLFSTDGRVFCAKKKGEPFPRREDVVAAIGVETLAVAAEPPAQPDEADAAEQPVAEEMATSLDRAAKGKPIGGKSKISKNWEPGKEPEEE